MFIYQLAQKTAPKAVQTASSAYTLLKPITRLIIQLARAHILL
jgi:hypothetical protein